MVDDVIYLGTKLICEQTAFHIRDIVENADIIRITHLTIAIDKHIIIHGFRDIVCPLAVFPNFFHSVEFKAEYATLHLGYKVAIPEGVKAYVAVSTNNGYVQFKEVTGVIPAATPVLLENVGSETTYTFAYTDNTVATVETNLLKGSIANRYVVGDAYVLTLKEGKVCFGGVQLNQLENTAFLNNANKAYLPATEGLNAASYSFRFEGEGTTGVEEVKTENGEVKAIYDLTGRKLKGENGNLKGIYIINGKKVLVK